MKKILLFLLFAISLAQARFNIYSSNDVILHVGEVVAVKGTLYEIYQSSKGNLFLNIDGHYPSHKFAGVIFSEDSHKFDILRLRSKIGTDIIIECLIKLYRGKPEIIIREKNQIINY